MSGKGGKGLLAGKTTAGNKDKDKKRPVSRSSRAGLQVVFPLFLYMFVDLLLYSFIICLEKFQKINHENNSMIS